MPDAALDSFKKADKQDGAHCVACQKNMIKYGVERGEWKMAETAAAERVGRGPGRQVALAHYDLGSCYCKKPSISARMTYSLVPTMR